MESFPQTRHLRVKRLKAFLREDSQIGKGLELLATFAFDLQLFAPAGYWFPEVGVPKGHIPTEKSRSFAGGTHYLRVIQRLRQSRRGIRRHLMQVIRLCEDALYLHASQTLLLDAFYQRSEMFHRSSPFLALRPPGGAWTHVLHLCFSARLCAAGACDSIAAACACSMMNCACSSVSSTSSSPSSTSTTW
jgi:hypothetical protein